MARKPQSQTEPQHDWNVRDAKAHLSQVVSGALDRPQRIARRDGAAVVVVSEEAYRSLLLRAEGEVDMIDYFRAHAIDSESTGESMVPRATQPSRATPPLS